MKNLILLFTVCCCALTISAQENCMSIGTNFHYFDAGVFKDLKLSSSAFFTRNASYVGDDNDWDSGLANTMPQDDAGYPASIPFNHPVTGEPQIVAFTVGGYNGNYRAGEYVMLYDGEATFNFVEWTATTVTATSPGRIEFNVDAVNENGIHIEITSTNSNNPIHNIRILEREFEENYITDKLYPSFVAKSNEFEALRFMDWVHTNHHPIVEWNQRTSPQFHTQNVDEKGMSWEQLITISNILQKDVWINVPHQADENYIDQMATVFRDQLDPSLTIYLEYSNECWNWIFDQTYWLDEVAPHNNYSLNYGYYSHRVFERWDMIFSGQEDRIKTVLGGHDYFVIEAMDIIEDLGGTDLVDLVSYPGYVALNESDYEVLNSLGASATASDVMEMLENNMEDQFYWMQQFKTLVADVYDKDFVMYEGGQHLTPEWFGLDTSYNQALYDAQIHEDMFTFYQDMLSYYQETLDIKLFMNYVLASPQENAFGSWGLLENYFVDAPYPPKWNAVMDWKSNNPSCVTTSIEQVKIKENEIHIFPNPAHDLINISLNEPFDILLYKLDGQLIQSIEDAKNELPINNLNKGMYIIEVVTSESIYVSKFTKM